MIPHQHYAHMLNRPPLMQSFAKITSVGSEVRVCGVFEGEVEFKDKLISDKFYVVDTAMCHNLLSRSASCALGIVHFADHANADLNDVFGTTGLMQTPGISIELREGAVPFAVTTARGVPLPMMKPVQEELERRGVGS